VENFRVRVLPVLGTMPALFGQAAAAFVLCQLADKPFFPQVRGFGGLGGWMGVLVRSGRDVRTRQRGAMSPRRTEVQCHVVNIVGRRGGLLAEGLSLAGRPVLMYRVWGPVLFQGVEGITRSLKHRFQQHLRNREWKSFENPNFDLPMEEVDEVVTEVYRGGDGQLTGYAHSKD
jgi:hypothetical protein